MKEKKKMKKWLAACLLAIALLFVTTAAMAGHTKANGEYCFSSSFIERNTTETTHTVYCYACHETFTENHFVDNADSASCIVKKQCGRCTKPLGWGDHNWGDWESNGDKTHTHVCTRDPSHTDTKDCTDFLEADCTTPAMCGVCGGTYGETDPDGHDWERPRSNGDGTHTPIPVFIIPTTQKRKLAPPPARSTGKWTGATNAGER